MTLDELNTMTTDEITRWLIEDAHDPEPQADAVQAALLEAAQDGRLSDGVIECWCTASQRASEHLTREAEQLRRYGRVKRAGIRGVVDAGQ